MITQRNSEDLVITLFELFCLYSQSYFFVLPYNILLLIPALVLIINTLYTIKSIREFISGKFIRPKVKSIRNILILFFVLALNGIIIFLAINSVDRISKSFPEESGIVFDSSYSITSEDFLVEEIDEPFSYFDGSTRIIPFALFILFIWVGDILFIDLIQPILVTGGVLATWPMAWFKRRQTINKAANKLKKFPDLKIIGITGSFGKTSTKEILFDILSNKYKTLMTPGNYNTSVGIAETILNELTAEHEVFIVEMGAYTMGEIRDSAKLTPPHISLITNIGKSHLDIFGSVENILKAKSEIYTHLRKRGIAIVNSDNERLYKFSQSLDKPKVFFGSDDVDEANLVKIDNINWDENNVDFDISFKKEKKKIKTTIVGRHQIHNLHAAIAVALQLKFSLDEISEILKKKEFKSSHFNTFTRKEGTLVIDDAYNSNPDGFNSALEYLNTYKKKKVVITRGLQEIGSEIRMIYSGIAEKLVHNSDILITTDKILHKAIENYDDGHITLYFEDEEAMNRKIVDYFGEKYVILVEGRVSPETMSILKSE
jgi:UDP-N-acetylmuramoyl-tripeptide--D-alanyl-D-alanine ligase